MSRSTHRIRSRTSKSVVMAKDSVSAQARSSSPVIGNQFEDYFQYIYWVTVSNLHTCA